MIMRPESSQGSWACQKDPDLWFPEKPKAQMMARKAKAACLGTDGIHPVCPVLDSCREVALADAERWGIWGGMSERERNRERKRRRLEVAALAAKVVQLDVAREKKMEQDKAARIAAKAKKPVTRTTRKPDGQLARFAAAKKEGGRLLPAVKQHLLARPQDENRHHELIHVSELAKNDWCPRATYKRIKATRAGQKITREAPHFNLDNIYEEGDRIHAKWQQWFWDLGVLWGMYKCEVCREMFEATSPGECHRCSAPRACLTYAEVEMRDEESLIVGHADGEIRDEIGNLLIEIKSVGQGTVRIEAPNALAKHSHKYADENGVERTHLDHDALWRDLKRPFSSHLRQGYLYLFLRALMTERHGWPELTKIVFIYEYKPTQATKEFPPITIDQEWVDDVVDSCRDIVWAVVTGSTPKCIKGRRELCKACEEIETQIKDTDDDTEATPAARRRNNSRSGARRNEVAACAPASGGRTVITRRSDRPGRRGADESARPVHSMGGLLRRAAGNGGG